MSPKFAPILLICCLAAFSVEGASEETGEDYKDVRSLAVSDPQLWSLIEANSKDVLNIYNIKHSKHIQFGALKSAGVKTSSGGHEKYIVKIEAKEEQNDADEKKAEDLICHFQFVVINSSEKRHIKGSCVPKTEASKKIFGLILGIGLAIGALGLELICDHGC